jgi:predicted PurR-regulated permease PerM
MSLASRHVLGPAQQGDSFLGGAGGGPLTAELTAEKRLGAALFYGVVAVLAYLSFLIFEPFLVPLGWAAVLVVVFYPFHDRLRRRWGRTRAALASTLAVTLILIVPALLVMTEFVRQGINAAQSVQQAVASGQVAWIDRAWAWVQNHVPGQSPADLVALIRQATERVAALLAGELGTVLRNIAHFLFDLAVLLLAMFYLFRDGESVLAMVRDSLPFEKEPRDRILHEARDLIYASVTSSLVAAAVHGLVGGIAFAVVGIGAAVFWGVMMAFCSLLPLVGSTIIWAPAAILLMVQGRVGSGIFVLLLCAGVVGLVDNIVRPWLISGRAQLNGLIVFISVLGGIGVFGLLGVVLGPIVMATAASVLDLYTRRTSPSSHAEGKRIGGKSGAVLE